MLIPLLRYVKPKLWRVKKSTCCDEKSNPKLKGNYWGRVKRMTRMTLSPEEEDAWCKNNSGRVGSKMQRFFTWTCCRCAAFTGGDPGGFGHLGHCPLFCCCSHHCYTSSTICNTHQVYSCILRITNPMCDTSFAWQAVHHVRRGGPVEEHHLGQLRLCRPLRFQPCKSLWWWLWCDTLLFEPISR